MSSSPMRIHSEERLEQFLSVRGSSSGTSARPSGEFHLWSPALIVPQQQQQQNSNEHSYSQRSPFRQQSAPTMANSRNLSWNFDMLPSAATSSSTPSSTATTTVAVERSQSLSGYALNRQFSSVSSSTSSTIALRPMVPLQILNDQEFDLSHSHQRLSSSSSSFGIPMASTTSTSNMNSPPGVGSSSTSSSSSNSPQSAKSNRSFIFDERAVVEKFPLILESKQDHSVVIPRLSGSNSARLGAIGRNSAAMSTSFSDRDVNGNLSPVLSLMLSTNTGLPISINPIPSTTAFEAANGLSITPPSSTTEQQGSDNVICKHYLRGKCRFRERCRHSHDIEICVYCNVRLPKSKLAASAHLSRCYKLKNNKISENGTNALGSTSSDQSEPEQEQVDLVMKRAENDTDTSSE